MRTRGASRRELLRGGAALSALGVSVSARAPTTGSGLATGAGMAVLATGLSVAWATFGAAALNSFDLSTRSTCLRLKHVHFLLLLS